MMKPDYRKQLVEFWPTIMQAWDEHGDKHPIIECDIVNRRVLAMPAEEYIDGLTDRTRKAARRCYERITREGGMMVFIRDSKLLVLESHLFTPGEAP